MVGRDGSRDSGEGWWRRSGPWAIALYVLLAVAYLAMMPAARRDRHSPYNHYALQAAAWLDGRLDLGGPPPGYTHRNDFASYQGRTYVSFPPVPAVVLLPFVAAAGRPEAVRDAQLFAWLAPLGPVLLFLALERLRDDDRRRLGRPPRDNAALALLVGLGTVYWFSAVQGSVWFAAHVVTMAATAGYLLASLGGRAPALAGLCLGLAIGSRPSLAFALPFFVVEVLGSRDERPARLRKILRFGVPLLAIGALLAWHNQARFGDPLEFGHRYLEIRWRDRIEATGLFDLAYLPRNLRVVFGGLPFRGADGWVINAHGLALWLTSPFFLWALWPAKRSRLWCLSVTTALLVALPGLSYQNTGWIQFGQRFSNDYAPFVILAIAVGTRPLGRLFWAAAGWALLINGFGAWSFDRRGCERFYFVDPTQQILGAPPS